MSKVVRWQLLNRMWVFSIPLVNQWNNLLLQIIPDEDMHETYEEDQDIVPEHDVSVLCLRTHKKN
jgi:hypothetical protein